MQNSGFDGPRVISFVQHGRFASYLTKIPQKHFIHTSCSVAMLAFTGYITTLAGARLPGMESVGAGFKAFDLANVSPEVRGVFPLTLFTILCMEFGVMIDATGESEFPGDYRNGFDFGWDKQTDEWKKNKRTIELNNGRAAQMGIAGIMVHELMGNLGDLLPATP